MALEYDTATNVSELVIANETNHARFENFCNAAISGLEGGAVILSTSKSWDLGRDGVGAGKSSGTYICTSLRDDVDAKTLADIERLLSTTKGVQQIYFCSSQVLSEHARTKLEIALRAETEHKIAITCFGCTQLVQIAQERASGLIDQKYGPEISNVMRTIRADPDDDTEIRGLRLALIASGSDESYEIRKAVYASLLLDVLSDGGARTPATCAREMAALLRLQRSVSQEAVQMQLNSLSRDGFVATDGVTYEITQEGQDRRAQSELEAAERLIGGRQQIRDSIEVAIGTRFTEEHFQRIWEVFEARMSEYFLARGDSIVAEVAEIVDEQDSSSEVPVPTSSLSFLEDFASAVGQTATHPQMRLEIETAVKDLFTDRTSSATNWLIRLSASFVAACALGLEYSSSTALARILSRTSLVLDTDVVLSLLGEGEPEHESMKIVVSRWKRLGGEVLTAEPVLEEVAYHASIAQADFDGARHHIQGTPEERARLIENVFVRAFAELISQKSAKPHHWRNYIGMYLGEHPRDWSKVYNLLSSDYAIGLLPPRSAQEAQLEEEVRRWLNSSIEQHVSADQMRNAKDKARRDAELYAAIVHRIKVKKATDPGATCLLVSSARRLAAAESKFVQGGEPQIVVSVAAVVYLISMLPDVSLGIGAMRSFLFDERVRSFSSPLERTLIRVVRASQEVSLPWARRGVLIRTVREKLIVEAEQKGEKGARGRIAELEREATRSINENRTVEHLRDALDAIAVDKRTETENRELRARIRELEEQLASRARPKR
ncbi:hypothetical protein ACOTJB_25225 [Achromobacter xylosoxidans]